MKTPITECRLCCLPRSFTSKQGVAIQLQVLSADEQPQLLAMYLAYQPRNAFQGLPPIKDEVCIRWVNEMFQTGIHVAAQSDSTVIIGHAALFPINQHKCEMLVVVCPRHQNLGIGTELVHACIDTAAELGFDHIWLPVDAINVRARHVYEKCGFEYVSNRLGHELDMKCDVLHHRRIPKTIDTAQSCLPIVAPYFLTNAATSPTHVS